MVRLLRMTGPRASIPADPPENPLRAALARGDRLVARSNPALFHLLAAEDHALLDEAVIAQVSGMMAHIAMQLSPDDSEDVRKALIALEPLRAHVHALALEWRLSVRLEDERALDPVLSIGIQGLIGTEPAETASLAMATLSAQARFAQSQRRLQLPLGELPAELFHASLLATREICRERFVERERELRAGFEEGVGRLALLARLVSEAGAFASRLLDIEKAGVALWLSILSHTVGETRDRICLAAADPHFGRLLLTLRAAGLAPGEAERQVLLVDPDAALPRGLHDVGTREAALWLAESRG